MPNKKGLILIEAVASVVIVSVSLVLIAQSLLTQMRTGRDFIRHTRQILALENQLGLYLASPALDLGQTDASLPQPYQDLSSRINVSSQEERLVQVDFSIWDRGTKAKNSFDITTVAYVSKQ